MVALLTSSLTLGCSFAFVEPPAKKPDRTQPISCTTRSPWPVVDLMWFLVGGIQAAIAASDGSEKAVLGAAISVPALFSAIYGIESTNRCNALLATPPRTAVPSASPVPAAPPTP